MPLTRVIGDILINDTDILEEIKKTNTLLIALLEAIEQGNQKKVASPSVGGGRGYRDNLGQDEKDALEDEIDLDWWFTNYGEEALPAKYMHAFSATGGDINSLYTKDEGDYIFSRMKDYVGEKNLEGTHIFTYHNKVWCKREKNARNCYGFIKATGIGVT